MITWDEYRSLTKVLLDFQSLSDEKRETLNLIMDGLKYRSSLMFETHKLNEQGFKAVEEFKTGLSKAISLAAEQLPEGREKSVFKTKVEEAVFFGTKAIASKPGNFTEIVNYPEESASVK